MQHANYRLSLDIQAGGSGAVLTAKRGDTGRRLFVTLTDGGRTYPLEPDCYPVLTARKPDGHLVFHKCTREGGRICCRLTEQLLAVPGEVACELRLYGPDGLLLTSAAFVLMVEDTVWGEGEVPESFDDFSALTALLGQNQTLRQELLALKEELQQLKNGTTFFPGVDEGGNLSWTNDGGLENPAPVNIKGTKGDPGKDGAPGRDGADGKTPIKGEDYYTEEERQTLLADVLEQVPEHTETIKLVAAALPKVSAVDFTDFGSGSFTETVDGDAVTHYVAFDDQGRPTQIDGIFIRWEAIG